ncbi:MAG: hypothetical protein K2Q10_11540 [Rhodospirillales bacterium]|nr:hypothetical protein [Rhodospirillales bacterium]
MLFEFEPSGVNDTYLRLTRNAVSCILAPADAWNGLVRLNYVVGGTIGGREPHIIFRALDVGWDDGRFYWKGKATPVLVSTAMVDVLNDRGLLSDDEAERMVFGTPAGMAQAASSDDGLMLRAVLAGCTLSPIYDTRPGLFDGRPPKVTDFALRTPSASQVHVLEARNGVPVLTAEARDALKRELG